MIHILPQSANIQMNGRLGPDKHAHAQHAYKGQQDFLSIFSVPDLLIYSKIHKNAIHVLQWLEYLFYNEHGFNFWINFFF